MRMTRTPRLCILIIVICIITPIGIGFMMPQTISQDREYNTGTVSTISSDIRNVENDYYGEYTGDLNNSQWGINPGLYEGITYIEQSTSPNSTPAIRSIDDTANGGFRIGTTIYDHIETNVYPYVTWTRYAYSMNYFGTGATKLSLIYSEGGVTHYYVGYTTAIYLPSLNKLILDSTELELNREIQYTVSTSSVANTQYHHYIKSVDNYNVITSGVNINEGESTYWQNGYTNYAITVNAAMSPGASFKMGEFTFSRGSDGFLTVTRTVPGETQSMEMGSFNQISILIDEDGLTVSGLSSAAISDNPNNRVIVKQQWPYDYSLGAFDKLQFQGINTEDGDTGLLTIYVYSTMIMVGKYEATENFTIEMKNYYSTNMEGYAIRFFNASTVSEDAHLQIAGHDFLLYSGGKIVYDGIEYSLTGSTFTVVNDGVNFFAYLNGVSIDGLDQSIWSQVQLLGNWGSIGVSIAPMTSSVSDRYEWTAGLFTLSEKEFAGIGLLAAVASFVLAALIGRRSGEKIFWLLITAGCCGTVYLALLL